MNARMLDCAMAKQLTTVKFSLRLKLNQIWTTDWRNWMISSQLSTIFWKPKKKILSKCTDPIQWPLMMMLLTDYKEHWNPLIRWIQWKFRNWKLLKPGFEITTESCRIFTTKVLSCTILSARFFSWVNNFWCIFWSKMIIFLQNSTTIDQNWSKLIANDLTFRN